VVAELFRLRVASTILALMVVEEVTLVIDLAERILGEGLFRSSSMRISTGSLLRIKIAMLDSIQLVLTIEILENILMIAASPKS